MLVNKNGIDAVQVTSPNGDLELYLKVLQREKDEAVQQGRRDASDRQKDLDDLSQLLRKLSAAS